MHSVRLRVRALLATVLLLSAAGSARAELYSFYVIGNSPNGVSAASAKLGFSPASGSLLQTGRASCVSFL